MILQVELTVEEYAAVASAATYRNEMLSEWARSWILEASDSCDNPEGHDRYPNNN